MVNSAKLDVLIYAHDGRGLGHVSRSLAIAIALKEIDPEIKLLFVSGCSFSQELIGDSSVDWLKLPAYKTKVINGKSTGIAGNSGFSDKVIGELRGQQIKDIVNLYKPKIVLVDHAPQGKHRELLPALESEVGQNAKWILGIRGVIGAVKQTISSLPAEVFATYYDDLFWYGDSNILGNDHLKSLTETYKVKAKECGYVSRLKNNQQKDKKYAGVIAIPWFGEFSHTYAKELATGLMQFVNKTSGVWQIFMNEQEAGNEIYNLFQQIPNVQIEERGKAYGQTLAQSERAIIYGGYNSLVDVLELKIPTLVCMRSMKDNEQQIHLKELSKAVNNGLMFFDEKDVDSTNICTMLSELAPMDHNINLSGAMSAALHIHKVLS